MTMASSTTNPTESVSAINDRLSTLNPSRYIAVNVPTMDIGSARLGMIVAETLRKNTKMTITTNAMVRINVNLTSPTDWRIERDRSNNVSNFTDGGSCVRRTSNLLITSSTTWTVLVPG